MTLHRPSLEQYLLELSTYNANPASRFSELKYLNDGALEYIYKTTHPPKETPAMIKGGAINDAVLMPALFRKLYCSKSSGNTLRYVMSDNDYYDVLRARDVLLKCLLSVMGAVERPVLWTDPETGINIKSRIDIQCVSAGFYELKAVSRVYMSPFRFGYHYLDMQWDVQNALYHDGLEANGFPADPVVMLVVQQVAPYDLIEYEVPHYIIEDGRAKYYKYLRQLKECRESGRWLGRSEGKRLSLIVPHKFNYTEDNDSAEWS